MCVAKVDDAATFGAARPTRLKHGLLQLDGARKNPEKPALDDQQWAEGAVEWGFGGKPEGTSNPFFF